MLSSKVASKSISFITDNQHASLPFVNAMVGEEFTVNLVDHAPHRSDVIPESDSDMFIIDSGKFSLEELSFYSRLRTSYSGLLVLLIDQIDDLLQVMLLEQGVDDLLVKPINPLLLLARIRALFRRNDAPQRPSSLVFNGLSINGGTRKASCNEQELDLSSKEFDLLWYLAKNAHTTIDWDRLYHHVFGIEYNGYDRSVDMYISRIRAKLSEAQCSPQVIKTVRGKGYLFASDD